MVGDNNCSKLLTDDKQTAVAAHEDICVLVVPQCRSAVFQLRVSACTPKGDLTEISIPTRSEDAKHQNILISRLDTNRFLPSTPAYKYCIFWRSQNLIHDIQYIHAISATRLGFGLKELEFLDAEAGTVVDEGVLNHSAFKVAIKHLETASTFLLESGLTSSSIKLGTCERESNENEPLTTKTWQNGNIREETFHINGTSTVQEEYCLIKCSKHLLQKFDRDLLRETAQFEVYLAIFNRKLDNICWLMRTTTGGDMDSGKAASPAIAWAVHPYLPLLAWLIPGHTLKLSHFRTQDPPLSICEALTPEVEAIQAIRFSPNGRYILIQAHDAIKNDLTNFQVLENDAHIMLCDLVEGRTVGLRLTKDSGISIDLFNDQINVYRLTRAGAVEERVYILPELKLTERRYLTFLPAQMCCTSCGITYDTGCNILLLDPEGTRSVMLSHKMANIGTAVMKGQECDPLILRLTGPSIQLDIIEDNLVTGEFIDLFPQVLNENNELLPSSFSTSKTLCIKTIDCECWGCTRNKREVLILRENISPSLIEQVKLLSEDYRDTQGQHISPQDFQSFLQGLESKAAKALVRKDDGNTSQQWHASMKRALGDDGFPFESWEEFESTMNDMKDVFDFHKHMKEIYKPGQFGVGCKIPILVQTFYFENGLRNKQDEFHWSSAIGVGWIEEDFEWFHQRFFDNKLQDARSWYGFRAYQEYDNKIKKLLIDKGPKGRRMRKYFGAMSTNVSKSVIDMPDTPSNRNKTEEEHTDAGSINNESSDETLPYFSLPKEYLESMSDVAPGMRRFFELQVHQMINDRGIGKLEGLL
ncbi:hypothetical protein PVAG01_04527 [Phlyctema vagabunda]|uniref:Uncharacterized protein n=1 Tax=Phlyctema vagabunda TaxID=108571 RepID=A0ABR4PPM3_9HELO